MSQPSQKRWNVSIEVLAEPEDAARIRLVLPSCLTEAGFVTVGGTTTVEAWLVEAISQPLEPVQQPRVASDWMVQGRQRKRMGRGPQS